MICPVKKAYLGTFALSKWEKMSIADRKQHTVSKCYTCCIKFNELQQSFPAQPVFAPSLIDPKLFSDGNAKSNAKYTLKELNGLFVGRHNHSFTEVLPKVCKSLVSGSQSINRQNKSDKTALIRECENVMSENVAIAHLAECESDASYLRKRMMTSFTKPLTPAPKKQRLCHIDSEKEIEILAYLKDYSDDKAIVWSALAKKFDIRATNGGHVIKQLAIKSGLDVEALQGKKASVPRNRVHKKKTGSNVPVPCMPSLAKLKENINSLIDDGTLCLGEPCTPYPIYQYKWVESKLEKVESHVYGRKLSFKYLREKMLCKHEPYMRLTPDDVINSMSPEELLQYVAQFEVVSDTDPCHLRKRLKELERTRHLVLWHDHSSVLSRGYILITLNVIYDNAVFDVWLYDESKHKLCLQEYVEQPEMYLVCLSSSSIDDQAALIADRLDCLFSLSQPVTTDSGIQICDVLRFFVGDHKAIAFEQGTQCGGNYSCGCCGIHVEKYVDQPHALRRKVRLLCDLQHHATMGRFGCNPNVVKPFESLTLGNLQNELRKRGCVEIDLPKQKLVQKLKEILEGVQRVPSLLLSNPKADLSHYNLDHYTILPCEPLHDLKGHLNNLLSNISSLLTDQLKTDVHDLIQRTVYWKDSGHTGADMRVGLLRVYHVLLKAAESGTLNDSDGVLNLIRTAVCISDILYSPPEERTPRNILRFYNACWFHHELCVSLFPSLIGSKFFGLYFHSLLTHAPLQFEIVCLRSVNTEANERLFHSVKSVAEKCTNRHPSNVIPKVLMHVQAKELEGNLIGTPSDSQDHRVSQEAKGLPPHVGTIFSRVFVEKHASSFQAHSERISTFLLPGRGVWWERDDENIMFKDGDDHPMFKDEGPPLNYFRSCHLSDVQCTASHAWDKLLSSNIEIPLGDQFVRVFDSNGSFTGFRNSVAETTNVIDDSTICNDSYTSLHVVDNSMICSPTQPSDVQTIIESPIISTPHRVTIDTVDTCIHPVVDPATIEPNSVHIVVGHEELDTDVQSDYEWKTTHGKALCKLLGFSADLKVFDTVHYRLRQKKKANLPLPVTDKRTHTQHVAVFQTKVSEKLSQLKKELQDRETSYYKTHGCTPSLDDIDVISLLKQQRLAKKLLAEWSVDI